MSDPFTHEPEVTDIYESSLGNVYQILYVDDQLVLMRDQQTGRNGTNIHRMERRDSFDKGVENGQFEYKPDSDIEMVEPPEMDWSEVDLIGETTSERLNDQGFTNSLEIQQASDEELLDVSGLGQKGLQNLREFA